MYNFLNTVQNTVSCLVRNIWPKHSSNSRCAHTVLLFARISLCLLRFWLQLPVTLETLLYSLNENHCLVNSLSCFR